MSGPWTSFIGAALGIILVDNLVLAQLLGVGPLLSASGSPRSAVRMGLAVTLVSGLASALCWPINEFILAANGLKHMEMLVFLLIVVFLVQALVLPVGRLAPGWYAEWGGGLPLTANCGVLGVVLQNVQNGSGFLQSVTCGVAGGLGFLLAVVLFASIRERLEFADCPKAFEGIPIAMVAAGLMALCFTGFSNLSVFG